jgi:hypothetical protein
MLERIKKLEKRIVDLYKKIKEGGLGGSGIESLSGDFVDNTDPLNPVLDRGYKIYTAQIYFNPNIASVIDYIQLHEDTIGDIEILRESSRIIVRSSFFQNPNSEKVFSSPTFLKGFDPYAAVGPGAPSVASLSYPLIDTLATYDLGLDGFEKRLVYDYSGDFTDQVSVFCSIKIKVYN